MIAVTGDDEDNIIVCQVAKEKYGEDNARILAGCGLGVCVHWSNNGGQISPR